MLTTFLSFAGPHLPFEIAEHMRLREEDVKAELVSLCVSGYVRFSKRAALHYEATDAWNPDDDERKAS